jgi:CheY-like chemotaxis protein
MVLIASPDSAARTSIARMVTRMGMVALVTMDGEGALFAATRHAADVTCAILDDATPALREQEVARALQRGMAELPIILLTDAAQRQRGLSSTVLPIARPDAHAALHEILSDVASSCGAVSRN